MHTTPAGTHAPRTICTWQHLQPLHKLQSANLQGDNIGLIATCSPCAGRPLRFHPRHSISSTAPCKTSRNLVFSHRYTVARPNRRPYSRALLALLETLEVGIYKMASHLPGSISFSLPSLVNNSLFNLSAIAEPVIMPSFSSLLFLGSFAFQSALSWSAATRTRRDVELQKRSLDSFIATESPYALNEILCNIGSDGCQASGVDSGIVIASPDQTNPDCETCPFHLFCYTSLIKTRLVYLDT